MGRSRAEVSASYASSVLPAPSYLSWQFAWSFRLGHTERGGGREEKTRAAAAASVAKFLSEKLICSICVRRMAAEEEEERETPRQTRLIANCGKGGRAPEIKRDDQEAHTSCGMSECGGT